MNFDEGFTFAGHSTKEYSMNLRERTAPTPEEKVIAEEVPFMQGSYDFSMILGERIFKNRTLSYKFETYQRDYQIRKVDEDFFKNWLMTAGWGKLVDTHDVGYYWWGKCTSVDVDDDHPFGRLLITLEFEAYPFMKGELEEGNDLWDPFNFLLDYAQLVAFEVSGSLSINLMNIGSVGVVPTITASAAMEIVKGGTTYQVPSGQSKDESFRLEIGENPMVIQGMGTIKFSFYKELI
ncbi:phage tail protein [Sporolactobacillus terrae]|uniref:Phage tail protein n=1 Tax=Sporolactobacillus terrae TaxID=269673 RepID=A0A5K7WUZ4_9BACL|nr:phage tail protein [Sporolactobacillus terrae]BBN97509.1 hypothetical protein St703_02140 [Sporolactobacillus terrae]